MATMKVLIADDHEIVRKGLRAILDGQRECEVVGEAADGRNAVSMAKDLLPDVVVMDMLMPHLNGLEAARRIHREFPDSHILILTLHDVPELTKLAQTAGAQGLVLKSDSNRLLIAAVEHLGRTDTFYSYKSSSSFANPLI